MILVKLTAKFISGPILDSLGPGLFPVQCDESLVLSRATAKRLGSSCLWWLGDHLRWFQVTRYDQIAGCCFTSKSLACVQVLAMFLPYLETRINLIIAIFWLQSFKPQLVLFMPCWVGVCNPERGKDQLWVNCSIVAIQDKRFQWWWSRFDLPTCQLRQEEFYPEGSVAARVCEGCVTSETNTTTHW